MADLEHASSLLRMAHKDFNALVNANKQLIARFEAKIKTTINRVWGAD